LEIVKNVQEIIVELGCEDVHAFLSRWAIPILK
jgi:hypothetical protein